MKREQWINSISNDELAFRLYPKYVMQTTCLECVFFKKDKFGRYKCSAEEWITLNCEEQFQEWLEEDMDA